MASFIVLPCPIRYPALRLRLCTLAQVTIRSPIPARPPNVSAAPPIFTPSLDISAIPRVINAALVLSPYPMPSATPAASAITFLSDPPSSIPRISGLIYTRNTSFIKSCCKYFAVASVCAPMQTVVGRPLPTSSA